MSQSETKEKLIQAGKSIISRKGFRNARVSDITTEAGVAHGTFYLYFKTKEELLLELLSLVRQELLSTMEEGLRLIRDGKLRRGGELLLIKSFETMIRERELAKIFFFEAICSSEDFREFYKESKDMLRNKLAYSLSLMKIKEPELKADILVGTARHLVEESILRHREVLSTWKRVLEELGIHCLS